MPTVQPASPSDATKVSEAFGDLDGDDVIDRFILYQAADTTWRVRARVRDATMDSGLRGPSEGEPDPEILGVTDADFDLDDDVFVRVHSGASTFFVQLWFVEGDKLTPALDEAGDAVTFSIAGSVTHGGGLRCRLNEGRGQLLEYGLAMNSAQTEYQWTEIVYEWNGGVLRKLDERSGALPADREAPARFYALNCEGVTA